MAAGAEVPRSGRCISDLDGRGIIAAISPEPHRSAPRRRRGLVAPGVPGSGAIATQAPRSTWQRRPADRGRTGPSVPSLLLRPGRPLSPRRVLAASSAARDPARDGRTPHRSAHRAGFVAGPARAARNRLRSSSTPPALRRDRGRRPRTEAPRLVSERRSGSRFGRRRRPRVGPSRARGGRGGTRDGRCETRGGLRWRGPRLERRACCRGGSFSDHSRMRCRCPRRGVGVPRRRSAALEALERHLGITAKRSAAGIRRPVAPSIAMHGRSAPVVLRSIARPPSPGEGCTARSPRLPLPHTRATRSSEDRCRSQLRCSEDTLFVLSDRPGARVSMARFARTPLAPLDWRAAVDASHAEAAATRVARSAVAARLDAPSLCRTTRGVRVDCPRANPARARREAGRVPHAAVPRGLGDLLGPARERRTNRSD